MQGEVGRQCHRPAVVHVDHAARGVIRDNGKAVSFVRLGAGPPVAQAGEEQWGIVRSVDVVGLLGRFRPRAQRLPFIPAIRWHQDAAARG